MPIWVPMSEPSQSQVWHGTTILSLRKAGEVVIAGDGQVSFGATVMKSNARKVRRLGKGDVIAGFAGATADAFALFERLEAKLEQHTGQGLAHGPVSAPAGSDDGGGRQDHEPGSDRDRRRARAGRGPDRHRLGRRVLGGRGPR